MKIGLKEIAARKVSDPAIANANYGLRKREAGEPGMKQRPPRFPTSELKRGIQFILESSKRDPAGWKNACPTSMPPMLATDGPVRNAP